MSNFPSNHFVLESAEVLAIGTELLLGQTLNTNAFYLAREISLLGLKSYFSTVVGDNRERILEALNRALDRSDLVICSGGLGPTEDDLSMATAAEAAGLMLEIHDASRDRLYSYFEKIGREMTANNLKQALLPRGAIILENHNGTAPGAIIPCTRGSKNKYIAMLPGPPSELVPMFEESLKPWISAHTEGHFYHHFVKLIGIGESKAETVLLDLIKTQSNPSIAPYASEGEVCFRISHYVAHPNEADRSSELLEVVRQRLGEYIYEEGERSMSEVLYDLALEQNKTLSFAESCTAGLAAATLADLPGSSKVLKGSAVTYSNEAKSDLLNVPSELIECYGAVSAETAEAMALGAARAFKSDLAIAITGIAGPAGGTLEKPVGTVFISCFNGDELKTERLQLMGSRARIRKVSCLRAFDLARRVLLKI